MQEFMLLIFNEGDTKATMSAGDHLAFVKKCEVYIGGLKANNQLIAAQPLVREGIIVSGDGKQFTETPFDKTKKVQVGYYHILAEDISEAIIIAKGNPEFEYGKASIEIRPVKTKENSTGFTYPK